MILADKISTLRKKNGWSQEELADMMDVSRQSVSKWESAQSIPDLKKILQLAKIFGVTTDYLLKDDIEDTEYSSESEDIMPKIKITLQDANEYLALRETASKRIALATFLCIMSPICLLILAAMSELTALSVSENLAAALGLIILLVMVAIAVMIYISCGSKSSAYEFLEKEHFETEYGVVGMVKEKQKAYRDTYIHSNLIGTCVCILSPIPLFIGAFMENEFLVVIMLCITILLAGVGVVFFITAGVKWASMQKLLQEGEYTPTVKKSNSIKSKIAPAFWLLATAIFLAWSFFADAWHISWIVWPVAGVMFAAVMIICSLFEK